MTITDSFSPESPLFIIGANVMASTTTIILFMLAAAVIVAAVIYGEWGHRY
jgi:hypothetical protein